MTADLSIIVCTYRRAEPLRRALDSVIAQRAPDGVRVELIVVDNSDDRSAEAIVAAEAARSPFPIVYIEAHPPNISVARNAGVAAATGPVIAFLDDDQQVDSDWLAQALHGVATHDHDVLFGPVTPVFEAPERTTAAIRALFSRGLAAPAGAELFAMGPRKTPGITLATNNSFFRTAAFREARFDEAFGNAGGEDYDLLCQLQAQGFRFGWLPSARVSEEVPARRCDVGYLRRRLYAGGQAFAAAVARASPSPFATRWAIRAKAAVQAVLMALATPVAALRGREAWTDHGFRFAGVLGKLSFGRLYPIYRHENDGGKRARG
ncbi:glycosyltransferase family 2 protein [Methylopila turkensis]|uniref:Glycosyl transferase n=1 Tax=Methylopila turkensis TaxID=1437816 RepID=A0A9W6N829_9HYPH|nr:glycosyltransferase family A protein [Methylopila turkensis]GLK81894.1 glycosyl transferase [Methylopila turkensis]